MAKPVWRVQPSRRLSSLQAPLARMEFLDMATREEVKIADQARNFLDSCERDLRANALAYKAEILRDPRPRTTAELGAIVHADGSAIALLMTRLTTFGVDAGRRQKMQNGLSFYGMTLAQAVSDRDAILAAANTQASASVTTDQAIINAADATLAAIPARDVLY